MSCIPSENQKIIHIYVYMCMCVCMSPQRLRTSVNLTWGGRMRADRVCGVVWMEEELHSWAPPTVSQCLHLRRQIHVSGCLWYEAMCIDRRTFSQMMRHQMTWNMRCKVGKTLTCSTRDGAGCCVDSPFAFGSWVCQFAVGYIEVVTNVWICFFTIFFTIFAIDLQSTWNLA